MTTPDLPDYAPPTVGLMATKELWTTGPAVALPLFAPAIDTSYYSSLTIVAACGGHASVNPVQMSIQWSTAGALTATQNFSMHNAAVPGVIDPNVTTFDLPVLGDTAYISFTNNNLGGTIGVIVAGSSMPTVPVISAGAIQNPLLPLFQQGQSYLAGASTLTPVGPFTKGVHLYLAPATGTAQIRVLAYVLVANVWTVVYVAILTAAAGSFVMGDVYIPNRALGIQIVNTSAATQNITATVSELP